MCFKPNLASGLFRERAAGRLALAVRRLVGRHIGLRLAFVGLRLLIFLIAFLSLRHGDPPDGKKGDLCDVGVMAFCGDPVTQHRLSAGSVVSPTMASGRYSHPRSPNAARSTPGGAYHPAEPNRGTRSFATSLLPSGITSGVPLTGVG